MTKPSRPPLEAYEATVIAHTWINKELIRISFLALAITNKKLDFSDHYVKLLFIPPEAQYNWPFDLAEITRTLPRKLQPIKRTYTLCNIDQKAGTFDIIFLAHGANGFAGVWAQKAQIGDVLPFVGPGGAWAPSHHKHYVLAGDESAIPAIMEATHRLNGASADVFLEVSSATSHFDLPQIPGIAIYWVDRNGATPGTMLVQALRLLPDTSFNSDTGWFIHGVAEMVKDVRRLLFVDRQVAKSDVSISGYWRLGMTEDEWQSSKIVFNRDNEAEEEKLRH
ncbi:siderophore-interacting protein [Corynebacterium kutscheri]|uniref:Siderophore-interacting protein n=1 Tax=Corynebacterium kutscheri TaxID=35755 RepID=A0A0F6TDA9_9CORY|nr:siderophore-interacting protein [Corynebacterium kutscheri]AKE41014.1 siderophore-interacting protein [Corynebacterium kutscheri]VEH09312.1 siderophore-interacting protein [Corynebacterium kutscheri]